MDEERRGRPSLASESKQVSVLISAEDHRALTEAVEQARLEYPGFSYGDLLRSYIRRCLDQRPQRVKQRAREEFAQSADPQVNRVRRLHAIARSATSLARELDQAEAKK